MQKIALIYDEGRENKVCDDCYAAVVVLVVVVVVVVVVVACVVGCMQSLFNAEGSTDV